MQSAKQVFIIAEVVDVDGEFVYVPYNGYFFDNNIDANDFMIKTLQGIDLNGQQLPTLTILCFFDKSSK